MRSVLACLLLLLVPATASAGWTRTQVIGEDDEQSLQALTQIPDGTVRAVVSDRGAGALHERVAPAGGPFGPARRTPWTPEPHARTEAASGAAVDVWAQDGRLLAAVREPGATDFGPPARVGPAPRRYADISAGISDAGDVVVVWGTSEGADVRLATRPPGGAFGAPVPLEDARFPELAVGADGTAIVAASGEDGLRVATRAPGAAFGALRVVDTAPVSYVGLAVAADGGQAGIAWPVGPSERSRRTRIRVLLGPAGGEIRRFAELGDRVGEAGIAVDGCGRAVVAWGQTRPSPRGSVLHRERFALAYKGAGRGFGATQLVGPTVLSTTPLGLTLSSPSGRSVVAFEAFDEGRREITTTFSIP